MLTLPGGYDFVSPATAGTAARRMSPMKAMAAIPIFLDDIVPPKRLFTMGESCAVGIERGPFRPNRAKKRPCGNAVGPSDLKLGTAQ
jgi:hypothetical protein